MQNEIYYKRLIKDYGLWYSPEMTATIIKEARTYNWIHRKDLNIEFYWKDVAKHLGISAQNMSRIITGKGFPSHDLMEKLIVYFDLVA